MIVGIVAVVKVTAALRLIKRVKTSLGIKGFFMPIQKIYTHNQDSKTASLYVKKSDGHLDSCAVFQKKETLLLGISMGNSYFTKERLHLIILGFSSLFENVVVLLADALAVHNYRIMGYPENKIKRKLRENSNHARNKIQKTIHEIKQEHHKENITFYQWQDVESFTPYHQSLQKVSNLYDQDPIFAQEINQIVLHVMQQHISDKMSHLNVINEAKWYFLKELAFIHSSADFFNSSVVSAYYHDFPLFNRTIMDELERVSFITYECKEAF